MALSLIFPVAIGLWGCMDNSADPDQMALSEAIWSRFTLFLKDICGYFQCAPFPRLQTGKVVWVLSFDP